MRNRGTAKRGDGISPAGLLNQNAEVASPCVNVCRMDEASGYCEGCHRTLDEIAFWSEFSADEKRAVLALLPARKKAS